MSKLHPKVIEGMRDFKTAEAMAFVMSFLDQDEYTALLVVDGISRIMHGEEVPRSLFPTEDLTHSHYRFNDGRARIFDIEKGFIEVGDTIDLSSLIP